VHGSALSQGWHAFDVDGVQQSYQVTGNGRVCVVHSGGPGIESDYLRMPLLEDRDALWEEADRQMSAYVARWPDRDLATSAPSTRRH
jgi:hypothetical protein